MSARSWMVSVAPAWLGLGILVLIAVLLAILVTRVGRMETELDALNRQVQVAQNINRQLESLREQGLWVHGVPLTGDASADLVAEMDAENRYTPLIVEVRGAVGVDGRVEIIGGVGVTIENASYDPVPVQICTDRPILNNRC